ncbi:uncharacterized protein LOC113514892 isoform X2 [Galleria mellonella]|uniref:Uncharacterized protein LOC113514892 isoform X2 n=1 Tax=Galleria mellonella TaxID=7137 RepID=A0A6J3CBR8_GALME|nr:uncharacterized protein LOC113514892 isoform X2 [Galleria mellonella]
MDMKIVLLIIAASIASAYGEAPTNYDLSRNKVNVGGYGHYQPGHYPYPSGPGYNNPGYYPNQGLQGPPGAHPGCPLCDSSVYSYCSKKQAHDACCCGNSFNSPYCYKTNCKFLYANTCEEHFLISNCCCVDLYKDAGQIQPVAVAV